MVLSAEQFAVDRQRDLARLLRDDDDDRVADLAHADTRAMARALVLAELRVLRQRQKASRRRNAVVRNDDSAVVQRRLVEENVFEQALRNDRVDLHTRFHNIAELCRALDDHQRTRAIARHIARRDADVVDHSGMRRDLLRLAKVLDRAQRVGTYFLQRGAQLGLKKDHERNESDLEKVVEQKADRVHFQQRGDRVQHHKQSETECELARAPIADKAVDIVEQDGKHRDINKIDKRHRHDLCADVVEKGFQIGKDRLHESTSTWYSAGTFSRENARDARVYLCKL